MGDSQCIGLLAALDVLTVDSWISSSKFKRPFAHSLITILLVLTLLITLDSRRCTMLLLAILCAVVASTLSLLFALYSKIKLILEFRMALAAPSYTC
jgi:hypothetical protein